MNDLDPSSWAGYIFPWYSPVSIGMLQIYWIALEEYIWKE